MSRRSAWLLAVLLPAGALVAASCASPPPPPPLRPLPMAPVPAPVRCPSAAPPTATVAPSLAPAEPLPPTGPLTFACGNTRCQAGAEMCCEGERPRCAPSLALPAGTRPEQEASRRAEVCGTGSVALCDDAGDCPAGSACCEEEFFGGESHSYHHTACRPLRDGKATCQRAERCTEDDLRCARRGTSCVPDHGRLRCVVPLDRRARLRCPKAPCPAGHTCVAGEDGPTCVPGLFRASFLDHTDVLECNRGRDCGEDESCYQDPQASGRRCDLGMWGVDELSEHAYCDADADCAGYCRGTESAVASCAIAPKRADGVCVCLPRCARDEECATACDYLNLRRPEALSGTVGFCDRARGACDCRARAKK